MVKSIRLRSKTLFFTYPKCDVPLQSIYNQLDSKLSSIDRVLKDYIICHELHKDGEPHRHCWLTISSPVEHVKSDFFDIYGGGKKYHGSYESAKMCGKAARYCTKDGDYITSLTPEQLANLINKGDGQKLNKEMVARRLLDGEKLLNLLEEYPALLFDLSKVAANLKMVDRMRHEPEDLKEMNNLWFWGPTGVGKSRKVHEEYPGAYLKNKEEFWGGYNFQEVVYLEDIDETWVGVIENLKVWVDYYKFNAKIKHEDPILIRPKQFIATSNYTIREVMIKFFKRENKQHDEELVKAIERRFVQVRMDPPGLPADLHIFPDNYFWDDNKENIPPVDENYINFMEGFDTISYNK